MRQILTVFCLILSMSMYGQKFTVKGKIIDKETRKELSDANICLKSTTKGAASNKKGEFEIKDISKGDYSLVVSYYGYTTIIKQITIDSNKEYIFELEATVYDLNTVVVTATRGKRTLKDVPVYTQLIHSEKLEQKDLFSIENALEYSMPDIEFSQGQSGTRMNFQGLPAKYTLILIDGERLAGELNGDVDYSRLSTSNIDHIEIVRGATSTLYGSNAIGGVVNIITKQPNKPLDILVSSRLSKYGLLNNNAYVAFKKSKITSKTNFSHKQEDAYDIDEIQSGNSSEEFKSYSLNQEFSWLASQKLKISLGGNYYYKWRDETTDKMTAKKYYDYSANLKAVYHLSSGSELKFVYNRDQYKNYNYDSDKEQKDIYSDDVISNLRIEGGLLLGEKNKLNVGIEYNSNNLKMPNNNVSSKKVEQYVAYAQNEYSILDNLCSTLGIRYNYNTSFKENITGSLGLMYTLGDLKVRANAGNGFRSPTLKEMYMERVEGNSRMMAYIYGNPELKPEKSKYISTSFEYGNSKIQTSLNLYYNDLDDLISYKMMGMDRGKMTFISQNIKEAKVKGFDYTLSCKIDKHFDFSGAYSYKFVKSDAESVNDMGIRKHSGRVDLGFNTKFNEYNLNIDLQAKIYSSKKANQSTEKNPRGEVVNLAGYSLWKLTTNHKINSYLSFTMGVDNIFNYTDKERFTTYSPGRTYFIGMKVNIRSYN